MVFPRNSERDLNYDPIEDDPLYRSVFEVIDQEVETILSMHGTTRQAFGAGWRQVFWYTKAQILKEKYGIDWKSPREMNPGVHLD